MHADSLQFPVFPVPQKLRTTGKPFPIDDRVVVVAPSGRAGALYGGSTLLELIRSQGIRFWTEGEKVRDRPAKPVRGVHLFIPGKEALSVPKTASRPRPIAARPTALISKRVGPPLADDRPTVICGHEWHNPRPDIEIRTIRMKGCRIRAYEIKKNAPLTLLLGISRIDKPRLEDYRGQ